MIGLVEQADQLIEYHQDATSQRAANVETRDAHATPLGRPVNVADVDSPPRI